jgi:hypothetical protein
MPDVVNRPPEPDQSPPQADPEPVAAPEEPQTPGGWPSLQEALQAKGGDHLLLAQAVLDTSGEGLTLRIPSGRKLAKARLLAKSEPFQALLKEHLGPEANLTLLATHTTASASEKQQERVQQFLSHPQYQRIVDTLNATIEHIEVPGESEGGDDDPSA